MLYPLVRCQENWSGRKEELKKLEEDLLRLKENDLANATKIYNNKKRSRLRMISSKNPVGFGERNKERSSGIPGKEKAV